MVLLKECAAYFPRDAEDSRRRIEGWVERLRRSGARPVLLTTVPIARPRTYSARAKYRVERALGRETRIEGLLAYNDWLRGYARREGIPLFDLEAVVRESETERWLRPEYDAGDRLHLNGAAYGVIDEAFSAFLAAQRPLSRR
jgi:lysophospholipase L1-like esterase